jgi:hypothetical protein
MVRGCALDSGSLTMDTEIVRITYIVTLYRRGGADNVRKCALDSGSLTMDTEIVRITKIVTVYRRGGAENGTRLCPRQWLRHYGHGDCPHYKHCYCLQARGSR